MAAIDLGEYMPPHVLIAYCTRSGSTREVAEAIGRTMREAGVVPDVKPMAEVSSVPEGAAVLLGTALYIGRFPKEFHVFVTRHRRELEKVRPWIFVLGPTEKERKQFAAAEEQARKELGKYPWLRPADKRVLGGKFDPQHLNLTFPMSLIMKLPANPMRKLPATDIRDWEWIEQWSRAIAETLICNV
jgi:menaquinone-dependent protoporphyrinogen oxidase